MSEQLHTPEDSLGLEILTHKLSALVFDAATINALNAEGPLYIEKLREQFPGIKIGLVETSAYCDASVDAVADVSSLGIPAEVQVAAAEKCSEEEAPRDFFGFHHRLQALAIAKQLECLPPDVLYTVSHSTQLFAIEHIEGVPIGMYDGGDVGRTLGDLPRDGCDAPHVDPCALPRYFRDMNRYYESEYFQERVRSLPPDELAPLQEANLVKKNRALYGAAFNRYIQLAFTPWPPVDYLTEMGEAEIYTAAGRGTPDTPTGVIIRGMIDEGDAAFQVLLDAIQCQEVSPNEDYEKPEPCTDDEAPETIELEDNAVLVMQEGKPTLQGSPDQEATDMLKRSMNAVFYPPDPDPKVREQREFIHEYFPHLAEHLFDIKLVDPARLKDGGSDL